MGRMALKAEGPHPGDEDVCSPSFVIAKLELEFFYHNALWQMRT